jgi:hypothetical protein
LTSGQTRGGRNEKHFRRSAISTARSGRRSPPDYHLRDDNDRRLGKDAGSKTQHRRIFDAVARTASSLKRDRRFADSPLEGDGFELSVPGCGEARRDPIAGRFIEDLRTLFEGRSGRT